MTKFEADVMAELLCMEELREIGRAGWDRCVKAELERARQEQFVRRVLEMRLYAPKRARLHATPAAPDHPRRSVVINTGQEIEV